MPKKAVCILQHLKLCQKQIHVVMNRNIAALPVPKEHPCCQEQKTRNWEQKPVFRYPQKPFLPGQLIHKAAGLPAPASNTKSTRLTHRTIRSSPLPLHFIPLHFLPFLIKTGFLNKTWLLNGPWRVSS